VNILPMVMGLMLIFACAFSLSMHKAVRAKQVENTYQAHAKASQKILNSYESMCYDRLRGEAKDTKNRSRPNLDAILPAEIVINHLNAECARLNLWPLVEDDVSHHRELYECAAQILRSLYGAVLFKNAPRIEYRLLDSIVESARLAYLETNQSCPLLEKLQLKGYEKKPFNMQSLYYAMLRGTRRKSPDVLSYPSLLEYFFFDNSQHKICLQHASIEMIAALFGSQSAFALYQEIHNSRTPLAKEQIINICVQNGNVLPREDGLFQQIDLARAHPDSSGYKIIVGEEADISLKQRVYFPG
jgi:hypothetical protein